MYLNPTPVHLLHGDIRIEFLEYLGGLAVLKCLVLLNPSYAKKSLADAVEINGKMKGFTNCSLLNFTGTPLFVTIYE